MGWEAGVPAGFDERTTGSPKDIEIDLASPVVYAAGWRGPMSTSGKRPHASRVVGGSDRRSDAERAVLIEGADGIACADAGCARSRGAARPNVARRWQR